MNSEKKKTVCFFNSNKAWGGGEKWHLTTAKEFRNRGHEVTVITNVASELAKKAIGAKLDVYSFFVSNLSFLNPIKILTLVLLFKKTNVGAIVLNLPSDLKLAGLAAKLAGVEKIIYRRGMPHPLRSSWFNRFLFRTILTHVVVNSEEISRSLCLGNESWFPQEKLVLIYNGVDFRLPPPALPKHYEKNEGEVVIGNAGRLTEQKGQKHLIEMAQILKSRGLRFKLLVAGEGELRSELERLIDTAGLGKEVHLLGHVDQISTFIESLDLFVFPSHYEGSANTLIETLYHGIPTIAFDVSSNPEIVQHEVTGLLAKPFEAAGLAEACLRILNSPELKNRLVQKGQELVRERFDSQKNLDRLALIIKS